MIRTIFFFLVLSCSIFLTTSHSMKRDLRPDTPIKLKASTSQVIFEITYADADYSETIKNLIDDKDTNIENVITLPDNITENQLSIIIQGLKALSEKKIDSNNFQINKSLEQINKSITQLNKNLPQIKSLSNLDLMKLIDISCFLDIPCLIRPFVDHLFDRFEKTEASIQKLEELINEVCKQKWHAFKKTYALSFKELECHEKTFDSKFLNSLLRQFKEIVKKSMQSLTVQDLNFLFSNDDMQEFSHDMQKDVLYNNDFFNEDIKELQILPISENDNNMDTSDDNNRKRNNNHFSWPNTDDSQQKRIKTDLAQQKLDQQLKNAVNMLPWETVGLTAIINLERIFENLIDCYNDLRKIGVITDAPGDLNMELYLNNSSMFDRITKSLVQAKKTYSNSLELCSAIKNMILDQDETEIIKQNCLNQEIIFELINTETFSTVKKVKCFMRAIQRIVVRFTNLFSRKTKEIKYTSVETYLNIFGFNNSDFFLPEDTTQKHRIEEAAKKMLVALCEAAEINYTVLKQESSKLL